MTPKIILEENMSGIKAGVIVATEFCRPGAKEYQGYIDYINREEAVRNDNTGKYNLYQDYMGNPKKTTGLFTESKNKLTSKEKEELKEIFTTAQENGSVMWQTVISFDNRWLKQHGIINEDETLIDEEKLKEVARGGVRRMLEAEGLENAAWSGAIHFNTKHLHIHIATVEPIPMREQKLYIQYDEVYKDGKKYKFPILDDKGEPVKKMEYKGRFKQSSIEKCKSYVVNELVNDKENNIKINNIIRESIVRQKKEHPLSADADFIKKFEKLYEQMPDVNRNLWNYNNSIIAPLRQTIDEISKMYIDKYHTEEFKELKERIAAQEEIYKEAYGNSEKDYASGKMKDLYTRLGNIILKEIRNYDKELKNFEKTQGVISDPLEENLENKSGVINDPLNEKTDFLEVSEDFIEEPETVIDDFIEPEVDVESSFYKWSDNYKKAKKLIHQKKPDYETAINLLIEEHNGGNTLATFELGDMYKYGRGRSISEKTAQKYYTSAFQAFTHQYRKVLKSNEWNAEKKKSYLAYRIGKMHYYGQGTKNDYEEALDMFEKSSNQYAIYMLGKMAYNGQGMEKDDEIAFEYFMSVAEKDAYVSYKAASMIEKGEVNTEESQEKLYQQAFSGFMQMEEKQEDDNLEYRIGMMYLKGRGTKTDKEEAEDYLTKSAQAGNVYAKYQLAEIYLERGNKEEINKAVKYLEEAAIKGGNAMAMYSLGKVYSSNIEGYREIDKAIYWYQKAEEKGNEFAAYKLGKIYLEKKETENAVKHLEKCNNKYAWYSLGKIYMNKTQEYYNPEKGIKYLEQAAEQGNVFAQYRIGREYYLGTNIEKDIPKAVYWLEKAVEQESEYAAYILGEIYLDNSLEEYYDPEKGMQYIEQVAEQGNMFAQYRAGKEYYSGEKIEQDTDKAIHWLGKASEQGNEYASYTLGKICYEQKNYQRAESEFLKCRNENIIPYSEYYLGKIYLDKNGEMFAPPKGIRYLEQSAEHGNTTAGVSLGILYLKGDIVKQNKVLGRAWIERAADEGNEFATKFLEQMDSKGYYYQTNFRMGQMRAMILCNATQFLKKALKDEWQKRQNEREHEILVSQQQEEKE